MIDGKFIGNTPAWVDTTKPPGTTSQDAAYCPAPAWWKTHFSGYAVIFGPNLTWLTIALAVYLLFPYDLEAAAAGFSSRWILSRAAINLGVTFAYTGFWHVSLYWLGAGKRPFSPNRMWRWGKVVHNLFYSCLGTLQWTGWEVLAMRAYATGRLPYLTDADVLSTASGALNFAASMFWVPLWRTWHFYFAHRLLHYRPLYKYVHCLHHRNTDIEPFAGLCMHPIEHLYYFACAAPSLYVFASPFAFMWNGIHALLSPAASHSGFEDHFQSDQFHVHATPPSLLPTSAPNADSPGVCATVCGRQYLHHKHFECNYGPSDCPLDRWFGTFKDKIEVKLVSSGMRSFDAKADLFRAPQASFLIYALLAVIAPLTALVHVLAHPRKLASFAAGRLSGAQVIALWCSVGPVVVGCVLMALTDSQVRRQPRRTFTAPFHKEGVLGGMGLHLLVGAAFTVMPVYHLIHMVLSERGYAAVCSLVRC